MEMSSRRRLLSCMVPLLAFLVVPLASKVAAPEKGKIKTKVNPKDGAEMIWIPAGEFTMGSNDLDDAKPPHKVYLDGYWIYKTEVAVSQYRKFCKATRRKMPPAPSWGWKDNHPVVNVTWSDATAYAKWAGVRLPTEAEWEKAARGTDGREYPWGNKWDASKCANSVGRRLSGTRPVGSYPQGVSPYGVHDVAGNVMEWCADWYDAGYYAKKMNRNPKGPRSGKYRMFRGGSWGLTIPGLFLPALRYYTNSDRRDVSLGFRCASGR